MCSLFPLLEKSFWKAQTAICAFRFKSPVGDGGKQKTLSDSLIGRKMRVVESSVRISHRSLIVPLSVTQSRVSVASVGPVRYIQLVTLYPRCQGLSNPFQPITGQPPATLSAYLTSPLSAQIPLAQAVEALCPVAATQRDIPPVYVRLPVLSVVAPRLRPDKP